QQPQRRCQLPPAADGAERDVISHRPTAPGIRSGDSTLAHHLAHCTLTRNGWQRAAGDAIWAAMRARTKRLPNKLIENTFRGLAIDANLKLKSARHATERAHHWSE